MLLNAPSILPRSPPINSHGFGTIHQEVTDVSLALHWRLEDFSETAHFTNDRIENLRNALASNRCSLAKGSPSHDRDLALNTLSTA